MLQPKQALRNPCTKKCTDIVVHSVETTDACTNTRLSPIVYTLLDVEDSSFGSDDFSSDMDYESPLKRAPPPLKTTEDH